jgi:hypothetical protein
MPLSEAASGTHRGACEPAGRALALAARGHAGPASEQACARNRRPLQLRARKPRWQAARASRGLRDPAMTDPAMAGAA